MKTINPIDYALNMCKANNDFLRPQMNQPFLQMEGACATNGMQLLYVEQIDDEIKKAYKPQSSPNCKNVLIKTNKENYKGDITIDDMLLYPVSENTEVVEIGGVYILPERYEKIMLITQMLGLDGWRVFIEGQSLLLNAVGVCFLVMGVTITDGKPKRVAHIVLHRDLNLFLMSKDRGAAFCENYDKAQKQKEEELRAKRHGNLWEVQVAKYAYFYVEAADEEKAKSIAKVKYDDVDDRIFDDSEIELECVQGEACLDDVPDHCDCIYTVDGWMNRDEYVDTIEDED